MAVEWSALRPSHFPSRERTPGYSLDRRLGAGEKRKIPFPCWESNPDSSAACRYITISIPVSSCQAEAWSLFMIGPWIQISSSSWAQQNWFACSCETLCSLTETRWQKMRNMYATLTNYEAHPNLSRHFSVLVYSNALPSTLFINQET
jgi:hypothetical protein